MLVHEDIDISGYLCKLPNTDPDILAARLLAVPKLALVLYLQSQTWL